MKKHIAAKRIVTVGGGKGGVGKSTLTAILAQGLARQGLKVGVLDADLYGPSIRIMMGPISKDVQLLEGRIEPAVCQGVKVIGLSYFQMKNVNITRAPVANALIEKMLFTVDWGDLDLLLIDLPPGTGDIPLTIMQKVVINSSLAVSGPQLVSLSDVVKFLALCSSLKVPLLGLVENMAFFEDGVSKEIFYPFGEGQSYSFCKKNDLNFFGQIPIDAKLSYALDCGKNIFDTLPVPLSERLQALCSEVYAGIQRVNQLSFTIQKLHKKVCLLEVLKRKITLTADSIQRYCPCARCEGGSRVFDPDIQAIERVGVNGVRFIFSSGCSGGIYPIELLTRIAGIE